MTNLYLSKEVYDKIEHLGKELEGEYRHPVVDDLIIVHPAYPYTWNERAVSLIKTHGSDYVSGYVEIYKDGKPMRVPIKPCSAGQISDKQYELHNIQGRNNNQEMAYIFHNVFYMGMCAVLAINGGYLSKSQTSKPKAWKRLRKRHKGDIRYDSHYIVNINKTYQQSNPESLSNAVEQRYHMRRGHWRYMKSKGERVWIKPYWAGNKDLGTINKDYKR
jgi:hypothetical protein|tara:strand:- start:4540 stop:5193 length:654 start_codon:yes stop_codon:yes gene_type:complete